MKHLHTNSYHPITNGLVEHLHRQLKPALKTQPHPELRWTDTLSLVLLGIRIALKEDIGCSAAELVYGTGLRLPGDFLPPVQMAAFSSFVAGLKEHMQSLCATPTRHAVRPHVHVSDMLSSASHVFVRNNAVWKPLQQPYNGPYKVINQTDMLEIKGRHDTVCIDRLKPAHLEQLPPPNSPPDATLLTATSSLPPPTPISTQDITATELTARTTRSGRCVH